MRKGITYTYRPTHGEPRAGEREEEPNISKNDDPPTSEGLEKKRKEKKEKRIADDRLWPGIDRTPSDYTRNEIKKMKEWLNKKVT